MKPKKKFIALPREKVVEIGKIKDVALVTVYAALNFDSQSSQAKLIRAWAMQNGGVEYVAQESNQKVRML